MKFHLATAEIYIPDNMLEEQALARTTHLCFAAHQDDIEIMAADPILTIRILCLTSMSTTVRDNKTRQEHCLVLLDARYD